MAEGRRISLRVDSPYQRTKLFQEPDPTDPSKGANRFYWGVWEPIDFPPSEDDSVHVVTSADIGRLDLIAYKFYGTPNLWWVIAHVNDIRNPLANTREEGGMEVGKPLRIPRKANVLSVLMRREIDSGISKTAIPVGVPPSLLSDYAG